MLRLCNSIASKLQRAHGGCLGVKCRRRTWYTAKSLGELCASAISEDVRMGKPAGETLRHGYLNT